MHDVPYGSFDIGPFHVTSELVCHPGPTVGYRIEADGASIAYMPDHEPALVASEVGGLRGDPDWTSGFGLAHGVDLLIHDAQYTPAEWGEKWHWGHCTVDYAVLVAKEAGARRLALFHHDPAHGDDKLDTLLERARAKGDKAGLGEVISASEGTTISFERP